ncbi:MAG TPA: Gfo/Idh/MocA family oxidoreductase [Thermoleophilia bacterium]|nr:Gfo/Idh/MocA family oxidoreductase [Thermoleophilia bacterium]
MKFIVVGLGSAGQRHARNIRTLLGDQADIVAVRRTGGGVTPAEHKQPAPHVLPEQDLGLKVFRHLDEALADGGDAVIVADPTSMHLATASSALAAGCAVLVEKPLSSSWTGIPTFLAAAADTDRPVLVGYQMRFHPLLLRLKAVVSDGDLGGVLSASCTYGEYLPDWHPWEDYRRSYAARRELGGGVLLTQIHDIDNLCALFGWPARVYSLGGHVSDLEVDVEDTATTVWSSRVGERDVPVRLHQDFVRRPPLRRIDIVLDGGTAELDLLAPHLVARNARGAVVLDEHPTGWQRNDLFLAEMRHFIACVEGREAPRVPPLEAARSLAVALAALRSQTTGTVADVSYPEDPGDPAPLGREASPKEIRRV